MKFPDNIPVYGDTEYRGNCPSEGLEQATFFNRIRREYPDTWGKLALHPKNEGKRTRAQMEADKVQGLTAGASDIIIPGNPCFVCELKRRDHMKSQWQPGQQKYLKLAKAAGAFVCIALGADAAQKAFNEWLQTSTN